MKRERLIERIMKAMTKTAAPLASELEDRKDPIERPKIQMVSRKLRPWRMQLRLTFAVTNGKDQDAAVPVLEPGQESVLLAHEFDTPRPC